MSATIPDLDKLAQWLNASLYITAWRPVPLTNYAVIGSTVYSSDLERVERTLDATGKDRIVAALTEEATEDGHAVIVFCPSKAQCEICARMIASEVEHCSWQQHASKSEPYTLLLEAIALLQTQPGGLHPTLAQTLPRSIAFHHAGLTKEERDAVERLYREGAIRVVCATSTLAAGINLPARRVIINEPKV